MFLDRWNCNWQCYPIPSWYSCQRKAVSGYVGKNYSWKELNKNIKHISNIFTRKRGSKGECLQKEGNCHRTFFGRCLLRNWYKINLSYVYHFCVASTKIYFIYFFVLVAIAKQNRDSVSDSSMVAKPLSSFKKTSMCYDPNLVLLGSDVEGEEDKAVYKEDENESS